MTKLYTLKQTLDKADGHGYAVGAFSARYTPFVTPILRAAEATRSPVIVQIAQIELQWYDLQLAEWAKQFWIQLEEVKTTVPVCLHLDHTQPFELIQEAIRLGFTSVMIDASAQELAGNIATTKRVVEYAHAHGVSVEAELGRIGTTDHMETENDEELYTNPDEAKIFGDQTQVDALAVSVGTAHGQYLVKQPTIDLPRIQAIRDRTPVHLVLHGGSGTPADQIHNAIGLPKGGISKVNIATDLELGLLAELGRKERLTDAGLRALPAADIARGQRAVQAVVEEKIKNFLMSDGHADDF
ncbi:MAG TPA: class II fructose-bisphosphate aldolase [Anaerolineae bacterium]|nr:class II fructose-bisphosphate aldolase [Anaerolineae bacterium]